MLFFLLLSIRSVARIQKKKPIDLNSEVVTGIINGLTDGMGTII